MKVVNSGSVFNIFSNDLKVVDELPVGTYAIRFNPQSGYSLKKVVDYIPTTEKIYGRTNERINKVIKKFQKTERGNLGVLLSGKKGMGKTLLAQELSVRAREEGLPVILVNSSTPSLVSFLDSIDQKVLVMFDEFEKVFQENEGETSQEDLLTLFDGTSNSQKLFVVTINNRYNASEYLFNRTGRFYYHFKMENLETDQVFEYAEDRLNDKNNLVAIKELGKMVELNYDTLESIVDELNDGENILTISEDLNIDIYPSKKPYVVVVELDNGVVLSQEKNLELVNEKVYFNIESQEYDFSLEFYSINIEEFNSEFIIDGGFTSVTDVYGAPTDEVWGVKRVIIKEIQKFNPLTNGYLGKKITKERKRI